MNHAMAAAMVTLLVFTGCTNVLEKTDDTNRIRKIDKKLAERDFNNALRESKKYVDDYPESAAGWCVLGWAYAKSGDPSKAHECFDKSLKRLILAGTTPSWEKELRIGPKGKTRMQKNPTLKAIKLVPDNAEAYSSLLVIELLDGNYKQAVAYGEKAWRLRKDLASIPGNLSIAYHYLGNNAKRDEFFKHSERLEYHGLETLQQIFDGEMSHSLKLQSLPSN